MVSLLNAFLLLSNIVPLIRKSIHLKWNLVVPWQSCFSSAALSSDAVYFLTSQAPWRQTLGSGVFFAPSATFECLVLMRHSNQLLPLPLLCHLLSFPSFSKDCGKYLTSSSKDLLPILGTLTYNSSNILASQHSDRPIFNGFVPPNPIYLSYPHTWTIFFVA